ncbi:MAG TPA: endolytic transglycosylase MltG [Actinomycetota bacterium]|nr:endolytic transglycosylase MltG [Actinomycetota bacterium]
MQDMASARTEGARSGRHRPRRGNWGLRISFLLVLLLLGAGLAAVRYYDWCQGASGPRQPLEFEVAEGAGGSEVVDALHERGVLRCGLVSKWLLRRSGLESDLRSGTFELTTNMTPDEAFEVLTRPPDPVPTVRLTIPEGFRLTQIADRVREVLGIPAQRFLRETERGDRALPPYLPEDASSLEGFLFPETYQFVEGQTRAPRVIDRLLEQFGAVAETLPWENAEDLGVTPYEVVIIASMIEKEAALEGERALIAGVIYNRLDAGMVLGIDATLLYDDPTPDGQLSFSDLEYDSPYNTRIHAGLPPTPIASPGQASLLAALEPEDTAYFYYVLCGEDGRHEFGVTEADHAANRARCNE